MLRIPLTERKKQLQYIFLIFIAIATNNKFEIFVTFFVDHQVLQALYPLFNVSNVDELMSPFLVGL